MNKDDLRQYHRDLAIYCLAGPSRDCPAMTAGELCEQMQVMAEHEGHPKACYAGIRPGAVAGILTALERQAMARREGERHNGRHGRTEPLWVLSRDPNQSMPDAPHEEPSPLAAAPAWKAPSTNSYDYSDMDREQLVAVATAQDLLLVALSHPLGKLEAARAQAREILRAAGLETA